MEILTSYKQIQQALCFTRRPLVFQVVLEVMMFLQKCIWCLFEAKSISLSSRNVLGAAGAFPQNPISEIRAVLKMLNRMRQRIKIALEEDIFLLFCEQKGQYLVKSVGGWKTRGIKPPFSTSIMRWLQHRFFSFSCFKKASADSNLELQLETGVRDGCHSTHKSKRSVHYICHFSCNKHFLNRCAW